jgi:hypothetical protein
MSRVAVSRSILLSWDRLDRLPPEQKVAGSSPAGRANPLKDRPISNLTLNLGRLLVANGLANLN